MVNPVHDLTLEPLDWRPHVAPVDLARATPAQLEAMKVTPSNTGVSPYVLVLAHDPAALAARSPLFNDIMYSKGGLSRGGREMGALAASVVNACVYCANVHANRHLQLEKRPGSIEAIFADGVDADLPQPDRAIFDIGVALTRSPGDQAADAFGGLDAIGLGDLEKLDLIHAVAVFGWANRLMHVLGQPVLKSDKKEDD